MPNSFVLYTIQDLFRSGFYIAPIMSITHSTDKFVRNVYYNLQSKPEVHNKIPIIKKDNEQEKLANDPQKIYRRVMFRAYQSCQDIIDISLFVGIYKSLVKEKNFYKRIDIPSLIDAFNMYSLQVSPRNVEDTILSNINLAWKAIKEINIESSDYINCNTCGKNYYYRIIHSNCINKKEVMCPFCQLQKEKKLSQQEESSNNS